ncbi:MAG: POTRA domain-containing protein [Candidatus Edwardsbacteria bacterium]
MKHITLITAILRKTAAILVFVFSPCLFYPAPYQGARVYSETKALPVKELSISGNRLFTTRQIISQFKTKKNFSFDQKTLEQDLIHLLERYQEQGYLKAEISSLQIDSLANGLIVKVILQEGQKNCLSRVLWEGNSFLATTKLQDLLGLASGKIFKTELFETGMESIISYYENHGFPYAWIEVSDFQLENDSLFLILKISEGPLVHIQKIEFKGNETTKDYVLKREMRIKEGEVYNQQKINSARRRLLTLGLFKNVGEIKVVKGEIEGEWKLLEEVEEKKNNSFTGLVGYAPAMESEKGRLTGLVDFSVKNLLGTGRKANLKWLRPAPSNSKIELGYEEPWLFSKPFILGFFVSHEVVDSTYAQTAGKIWLRFFWGTHFSFDAGFGEEIIVPGERKNNPLAKAIEYKGTAGTSLDFKKSEEHRGGRIDFSLDYELKKNYTPLNNRVSYVKMSTNLEWEIPVRHYQIFAFLFHGRKLISNESPVPVYELFPMGGANSLRGYREEEFSGEEIVWLNTEYRFLLRPESFFFFFIDLGYFKRKEFQVGRKPGYGLGLRLNSRLGIIGLDYGLGEKDGIMDGKIHLGLKNEF